jgi:hypothetical protein
MLAIIIIIVTTLWSVLLFRFIIIHSQLDGSLFTIYTGIAAVAAAAVTAGAAT